MCLISHFDVNSGDACPRCGKVVARDSHGREIDPPEVPDQAKWLETQAVIERAKKEILADMASRRVPAHIHCFHQLHDYVNPNAYGGAFEEAAHPLTDAGFWDGVRRELDQWLWTGPN